MVKTVVMYNKAQTFSSVSLDVAAIGTDNGLHTALKRVTAAGDEVLVQGVPGLCDMSLQ